MCSRIQSISLRTRASGRPRAASAISVISSSSCLSRASVSVLADDEVSPSGRLDLGVLLGLKFVLGERGAVVVAVDALGEQERARPTRRSGRAVPRRLLPAAAGRCGDGPGACGRTPRRTRADAAAARRSARPRRPACASSRRSAALRAVRRYWSRSTESRSSGVVGRQAVDVDLRTTRLGKPPSTARMSSLSRRTMTSSSMLRLAPARRGRIAAGRGSPAGRRSCWSGRCAAWPRGTGGARTARPGRGRLG